VTQTPTSSLPRQLIERIQALGLTLLRLSPQGKAQPVGPCSWFEQTLVDSTAFTQALARHAGPTLGCPESPCAVLLEGVYLAEVSAAAASDSTAEPGDRHAVLMLGPELLESDALRQICGHASLDWQATVRRVKNQKQLSAADANRLALTLRWMQDDAEALTHYRRELGHLSEELANSYEELSLLYKLSCSMTLDQEPAKFFDEACRELQEVSGLGWIALQISEDQPRLQEMQGCLHAAGTARNATNTKQLGNELIKRFAGRTEPLILDDCSALGSAAPETGKSLLVVPLVREGQTLGVLFGGDRLDGQYIDSIDAKLCASLCNSVTIFLENHMLLEDAHLLFLGTLHALTSAIDAKDSYTFGHSERVALLSEMLARAAGIDEPTVERIYLAGLVHDVGKIGVPEEVLCKPGRLTEEEFDLIKMHPGIGANILRDIRQMDDLIPGVLFHHERWDGCGYPEKRAGLDTPLFGRVIGIADAFDAMSSDRTYRAALKKEKVLEEIERHAGRQFDPDLAKVFLTLDFEPYFKMIQRHRTSRTIAADAVTQTESNP